MGRRLHVAVVGHSAALSGGELALSRVLPDLLAEDSLLITIVLAEDGPLVPVLRSQGARVVILPLADDIRSANRYLTKSPMAAVRAGLPLLAYTWRLAGFLRSERVDLVHTNTLKAAVYGGAAGRLARIPVLWHLRDRLAADYLPGGTARAIGLLGHLLPQQIAVNSAATASTLPARLADRAQVVPDCIQPPEDRPDVYSSPGFFPPLMMSSLSNQSAECEGGRVLWLGMMGRLALWKGQHIVIRAFASAFDERDDVRLAFVGSAMFGDADYETELKAQVEQLGLGDRVEFRGFRSDIWAEYAGFDVAVHASVIPEPFGQVVIEAMAAGVPVVAAADGGPAEIITHDIDGLLIPSGDDEALGRALRRLVDDSDLRHRLGNAGRIRSADFTPAATAAELVGLYRRVCGSIALQPGTLVEKPAPAHLSR